MVNWQSTAGVIFTFNRPDYLQRTLNSIENNVGVDRIDWFVYVDGHYNQKSDREIDDKELVDQSIEIIKQSDINWTEIFINDWNQGIAIQKDRSHHLYDHYETVMFFEDDMILGKHYLRLSKVAIDQFPEHMILMNRHPEPQSKRKNILERCGIARVWGYALKEDVYRRFEKKWKYYMSYMNEVDYNHRFKLHSHEDDIFANLPHDSFSHDVTLTNLLRNAGCKKLWPEVSRGLYIGKKGNYAYLKPHFWKKRDMHKQNETITYDSDEDLKRFKLK